MVFVIKRFGRASIYREQQNRFLAEYCKDLRPHSVLNLGATPKGPDKQGRKYGDYFPGAEYRTLDLAPSPDPSHIQADLMALPANVGAYDLVLAMSLIEHIDRPWVAAPHIVSLINPGGHLYVTMPWFYPVHEGPFYGDHWRATPSGLRQLFPDLAEVRHDIYPSSIFAVRDRRTYWQDKNSTYTGFSMLFQRVK